MGKSRLIEACSHLQPLAVRVFLLLALAIGYILGEAVPALSLPWACEEELGDPADCDPGAGYEAAVLIPDGVFLLENPRFVDHFQVWVCWNPGESTNGAPSERWSYNDLREFASYIVHPGAGENGMAKQVLDYFGEDAFPLDGQKFGITTSIGAPANQDTTYERFKIYIHDTCRHITATEDYLTVHIAADAGQFKTPWEVARDAFAHEWQHLCYQSWTRTNRMPQVFETFDELCSMLSVAKYGRENPGSGSAPYDNSLSVRQAGHFAQDCMNAWPENGSGDFGNECKSAFGNAYNDWAMFAIYLDNVYTLPGAQGLADSLVYRWIRTYSEAAGERTYHHDFTGLGMALDIDQLDHLFSTGAGPYQRVKEAFRAYGVAKFLNLQAPQAGEEPYQWLRAGADADGYRPQELYNFLQDADGYCYNNIHTFPLYHTCSADRQEVAGWQASSAYWASCEPPPAWYVAEWEKTRLVKLLTYGSNYIVLLPAASGGGNLNFSLRFLDEYDCMTCLDEPSYMQPLPADYAGKVALSIDLISYDIPGPVDLEPGGASGLDYYGEHVRAIETHWVEPDPNEVVDFNLDSFAQGDEAVAVVLSLVPKDGAPGSVPVTVLPFEYRFQIVPSSVSYVQSPVTTAVTLGAGQPHWIAGELLITPTGSLTVEEGAQVYFCGEDAKITVDDGALFVEGTTASPVEFVPSNLPGDTNTEYAGLFAENRGLIDIQHCLISGMLELAADSATVRIADTVIYMAESDDNAIILDLQNGAGETAFENVLVDNVNRMRLDSGVNDVVTIRDCVFRQRDELQSLLSMPPPLVFALKGELEAYDSYFFFLRTGIQVGEKYLPFSPVATLEGLVVRPVLGVSSNTTAIQGRGWADLNLLGCEIRYSAVGVRLWDSADLSMRSSNIHEADFGLINYAFGGSVAVIGDADLGDGDQSNIISPSTSASDCWVNPQGLDPCYEPSGLAKARIYNATLNVIPAQHNRWGTCDQWSPLVDCFCADDFFPPNQARVDFSNRNPQQLSACSEFLDPPGFFLGAAAPAAAPEGAWPNPFNGQIHFRYRARGQAAALEIFDILGRSVRHLQGVLLEGGDREFVWEGDTDEGAPVSSGVYLYRVAGQGHLLKGKVIYVK